MRDAVWAGEERRRCVRLYGVVSCWRHTARGFWPLFLFIYDNALSCAADFHCISHITCRARVVHGENYLLTITLREEKLWAGEGGRNRCLQRHKRQSSKYFWALWTQTPPHSFTAGLLCELHEVLPHFWKPASTETKSITVGSRDPSLSLIQSRGGFTKLRSNMSQNSVTALPISNFFSYNGESLWTGSSHFIISLIVKTEAEKSCD